MKRGIDKRWGGYCLLLSWLLVAVACTGEIEWPNGQPTDEPLRLTGVVPTMAGASATKADAQAEQKPDEIYVGRKQFVRNDAVFFTKIRRTAQPLEKFSYVDQTWKLEDSWTHLPAKDETAAKKIYWSDGHSAHTFVGYGLPQQTEGKTFDWVRKKESGSDIFYGSIGEKDADATATLVFTETLLQEEDLVLAHSEDLIPEKTTGIANVPFYHALAQVRVIVDLVGFSASEQAWDNGARVSEMVLKQLPMGYRWLQATRAVEDVVEGDEGVHTQRDVQLWTPTPFKDGVNTGMSRQFHFYGLAVPGTRTDLPFRFKVRYPDPTKNDKTTMKEEHYQTKAKITFIGGKCTTIKISLNHESEDMTVSAIYVDWGYADMPDQIALHKKSTFLQTTDLSTVTTHKETHTEVSDYTWLHTTADGKVVDDKDNNGSSEEKAYCITSTQQLLSFAKEVNQGYDFAGKHVRLDASLTLQPTAAGAATMSWMGIGTATNSFKGTLHGGGRTVSRLNGAPLFNNLPTEARVEHLTLKDAVGVDGRGLLAHSNGGAIVACRVQNGVTLQGTDAVGSLVGTNTGTIVACSHDGDTRAANANATAVGGLVGENNGGTIVASFQAGAVTGGTQRYGVAEGGTLTGCYYNLTLATDVAEAAGVAGKATDYMQHPNAAGTGFVADLNQALRDAAPLVQYEYVARASSYPIVQAKSGSATTP